MKKKNVALFNVALNDLKVARWLSSQRQKARIIENALAYCLSGGPGTEAYISMFLPAEARAPWPAKNGKRLAGPATNATATAANRFLGDFAAPPRPRPPSAAGDFK